MPSASETARERLILLRLSWMRQMWEDASAILDFTGDRHNRSVSEIAAKKSTSMQMAQIVSQSTGVCA